MSLCHDVVLSDVWTSLLMDIPSLVGAGQKVVQFSEDRGILSWKWGGWDESLSNPNLQKIKAPLQNSYLPSGIRIQLPEILHMDSQSRNIPRQACCYPQTDSVTNWLFFRHLAKIPTIHFRKSTLQCLSITSIYFPELLVLRSFQCERVDMGLGKRIMGYSKFKISYTGFWGNI
jgi:hypothetical protein